MNLNVILYLFSNKLESADLGMNKRRIEEVRCMTSGQPIRFRFETLISPPFVFVMDGASVTQESTLV